MNVLLVHGLGRTPTSMFGLAAAFRRAGHHTSFFAYSPTFESLPRIVRRLASRFRGLGHGGQPVGLVGHSLGGLLLRLALADAPAPPVHRLVMLGTPNRSSGLARLASRWRPFRLLTRDCGRFLACPDTIPALPVPAVPYTLVAGTAGPRGRWSPFGDHPNDGIVAAAEVPVRDTDSPLLLPVWHSFMMDDATVRRVAVAAMMTAPDSTAPP